MDRASFRFVLVFAVLATTLLGFYYFPYAAGGRVRSWLDAYLHDYAAASGFVLRWFEPHVTVQGPLITGRFSLRIVRTCDAMDVKILFLSAVFAWPARWATRLTVALGGVFVIFLVNVLRICSLYYIGVYWPGWFEFAHLELWPAIILLVAVGMFICLALSDADREKHVSPSPSPT
jgi:exosortase/archaeosortase family protein